MSLLLIIARIERARNTTKARNATGRGHNRQPLLPDWQDTTQGLRRNSIRHALANCCDNSANKAGPQRRSLPGQPGLTIRAPTVAIMASTMTAICGDGAAVPLTTSAATATTAAPTMASTKARRGQGPDRQSSPNHQYQMQNTS